MRVDFNYSPLPVHVPFHTSLAKERAMAGAMGSGKSYALCSEAIAWCLEQPGIRGVICRKSIPALRDTTEAVFFDLTRHLGEQQEFGVGGRFFRQSTKADISTTAIAVEGLTESDVTLFSAGLGFPSWLASRPCR